MFEIRKVRFPFRIQLFAEGGGTGDAGSGVTGADAGLQSGVNDNAAGYQQGAAEQQPNTAQDANAQEQQPSEKDRQAAYKQALKDYKDLDDRRVQALIQKRVAGYKAELDNYTDLKDAASLLAVKYGIDPSDFKAIAKAIREDNSYLEEEALKRGMSVEDYREVLELKRHAAELEARESERVKQEQADRQVRTWMHEAESVKEVYPSFDLEMEMADPAFVDLLKSGVPLRTAYEVQHINDIVPSAMQFTAKTVEQKIVNKIAANGARPAENGSAAKSSVSVKRDVSSLTDEEIVDMIRRSQQGEKVIPGM